MFNKIIGLFFLFASGFFVYMSIESPSPIGKLEALVFGLSVLGAIAFFFSGLVLLFIKNDKS